MFRSQSCCYCLDVIFLICDSEIGPTKGSRKFVPGKKYFSSLCFVKRWPFEIYFMIFGDNVSYMSRRFLMTFLICRVSRSNVADLKWFVEHVKKMYLLEKKLFQKIYFSIFNALLSTNSENCKLQKIIAFLKSYWCRYKWNIKLQKNYVFITKFNMFY